MPIAIKAGVEFVWHPGGFMILEALKDASRNLGIDITITSGSDGEHSGPTDPHKLGLAYDIRTHDYSPDLKAKLLAYLKQHLGPRFYAFLEAPGTGNEHIHIQRTKGMPTLTIEDYLKA